MTARSASLAVALALWPLSAAAQSPAFCAAPQAPDRILSVSAEGAIALGSGALARLADIRLPDEGPARAEALASLKPHESSPVQVSLGAPNRWERVPARIASGAGDLARGLVERGLALVDAAESGVLCQSDLLKLEAEARAAKRGLWTDEANWPVQAEDEARLRQRIGRFALVEGRISSLGERGQRTYLNFGRNFAQDFTITIPKRSWATMTDRGLSAATLSGRRVRARGIVEEWNGTALTLQVPELLEILD